MSDEERTQLSELAAWRVLYWRARQDKELRQRIFRVVGRTPLTYGRFWLAALASLGEPMDLTMDLPTDDETDLPTDDEDVAVPQ